MKKITLATVAKRLERLQSACRNSGLRITHQRMEVFREVAQTEEHPDAETIFRRVRVRMPNISHDTVYRTLASLAELGLASRVDPVGGRARYDANAETHHHFVCTACGAISDVYIQKKIPLPEGIDNLGSAESVHIQIRGLCRQCNK